MKTGKGFAFGAGLLVGITILGVSMFLSVSLFDKASVEFESSYKEAGNTLVSARQVCFSNYFSGCLQRLQNASVSFSHANHALKSMDSLVKYFSKPLGKSRVVQFREYKKDFESFSNTLKETENYIQELQKQQKQEKQRILDERLHALE